MNSETTSETQENVLQVGGIEVMGKPTLVFGASLKPSRTSYTAINMLRSYGHTVYALGGRPGKIHEVEIHKLPSQPTMTQLHTVTLYMNAMRQEPYHEYLLGLQPRRIIFNPGAENDDLYRMAEGAGIEVMEACTLVMLNFGQF